MNIKQYKSEYKLAINELISDDNFVREDIIKCLEQFPQYGIVVEDEKEIIAIGVFTGADKESSMTLYVKPSRRKVEITIVGGFIKWPLFIISTTSILTYVVLDRKKLRCPNCRGFENLDRLMYAKNHVSYCRHCGVRINISEL